MNLVEKINLPNTLIVYIWDRSRKIAADTASVAIEIIVPVEIKRTFFESPQDYEVLNNIFGSHIDFKYRKERSFVRVEDKDAVFNELLEDFKKDALRYLARPNFAASLILSRLSDIKKRPHRYRKYLEKRGDNNKSIHNQDTLGEQNNG
ncbi:MAG: hypothetical protein M0P57_02900 [Syntrophales bacterium]|nr:hypothetical protein [Syntrophales bacterium]MDY0043972.1 hypothetical protein [Syntrophales bacterium]